MAFIQDITRSKCRTCGKFATKTVYNRYNASIGNFCSVHAKYELKMLEKAEKEYDDRRAVREVHES